MNCARSLITLSEANLGPDGWRAHFRVGIRCGENSCLGSRSRLLYRCPPLHWLHPCTESLSSSITGMVTVSCPAITSRQITAFPFMLRRSRSTVRRILRRSIGTAPAGTISAGRVSSAVVGMAAAMVRAGPTHLSGRCGIADELRTDVKHLYRKSLSAFEGTLRSIDSLSALLIEPRCGADRFI